MPLPVELLEGMNRVVAPTWALRTDMRSGWWIELSPAEYCCRAEARLLRKPSSSEAPRFSSTPRIWSSVSTVRVILIVMVMAMVVCSRILHVMIPRLQAPL